MVYFAWLLMLLFGGVLTAFGLVPWWIGLIVSALGVSLTLPWTVSVPARWALTILNTASGELRSVGPGIHFYGLPVEKRDRFGEIKVFSHSFQVNAEAENKDVVPLRIHLEYKTVPRLLHRWFIVGEDVTVSKFFEERAKSKITERVFDFGNRELVYDRIDGLAKQIREDLEKMTSEGRSFQDYCGVEILDFRISDVELPQAIVDAEVKKEVAEEERKAKKIEWDSVEERAKPMIDDGVSPENARKMIQVQDGKRKAEIHEIEIGKNFAGIAKDLGEGISGGLNTAAGFLSQFLKPDPVPTVSAPAPKPPAQPRIPRQKPPFRAVVEVNDPSLAQQIIKGKKKVELEVKDGGDARSGK